MSILAPPNPTGNNQVEPWVLDLQCDPPPTQIEFDIAVGGAFVPDLPLPTLTVGIPATCFLRSPHTAGDYTVKFSLVNADKCIFVREAPMTVLP